MAALPAAVLGNGALLATFSERGRVEQLWWPHPDRDPQLGELRLGIKVDGTVTWLDAGPYTWTQAYVGDSLRTVVRGNGLHAQIDDRVCETEPVLVRRVTGATGRVVVNCRSAGAAAVAVRRSADVVVCALGSTKEDAEAAASRAGFEGLPQNDAADEPPLERLYRRSLFVFDVLADRETGAVIAAPELDPERIHSGGYGFVWARDLAFGVLAFLAARRDELAQRALLWLPRAQEPEGLWLQRHWTDGTVAPSWCAHQIDETGSVVFAYEAAWRTLHDEALDETLWPSARRAADFMLATLDERGIPRSTADLWEERHGCHAYTAASVVGGLRAAASFASRHEPALHDPYIHAAERLSSAIERCFWSDSQGRYLRTLGDPTVDASLLGLAWPFAAVDPRGGRMRATVGAIERTLGRTGGGILRYEHDTYAGGNPWVLAALWLGLWRRQVGDEDGHARALAYAQRVATPLDLLPEQVTDDGRPAWVLPLAWSHAMFVLCARPELSLIRSTERVTASRVRVPR